MPAYLTQGPMDISRAVLDPQDDSLSLSLLRARAERLLRATMRTCNPVGHDGPVAARLFLIDDPESTGVEIARGCWSPDALLYEASTYRISLTPRWLEESPDEEIRAVFAHELGHAVNGDLMPGTQSPWIRWVDLALPLSCAFGFGMLIYLACTGDLSVRWKLLPPIVALAVYWVAVQAYIAHRVRKSEYAADAYAAAFGFAVDLMEDLRREASALDRLDRWYALSPFARHPPYHRRRKAVEKTALRVMARGVA